MPIGANNMAQIQISRIADGELSWGLTLIDDQQIAILSSVTPVSKAKAHAAAKTLKHKGADAPVVMQASDDSNRASWIFEDDTVDPQIRFSLVKETQFKIIGKFDTNSDPKAVIENILKTVQDCLRKVEIKWLPAEADPAHGEKTTDLTEVTGIPGS